MPFLETEFAETQGQFSPDARWIAYSSNESGRQEIYIRPFPAARGKFAVSTKGGSRPKWRRDGKELYYLDLELRLMAVSIKQTEGSNPSLEIGVPSMLFDTRLPNRAAYVNWFPYAPAADGSRFPGNMSTARSGEAPLSVVVKRPATRLDGRKVNAGGTRIGAPAPASCVCGKPGW